MGYLQHTSCYLVGPVEHDEGFGRDWREVMSEFLATLSVKVYNPLDRPYWIKPIEDFIPPSASRQEVLDIIYSEPNGGLDNEEEIKELVDHSITVNKYIKAQELVRSICLRFVATCDFIICYLPSTKTYGSTEELAKARDSGKPVIAICPEGIPSLWVYDYFKDQQVFEDLRGAMDFMTAVDTGKVHLDALEWIFLGDEYGLKSITACDL